MKSKELLKIIPSILDNNKATNIVTIDLRKKNSIADYLVIATGENARHSSSLAQKIVQYFKQQGLKNIPLEGLEHGDWIVIDLGSVIVHIFREEVRDYYQIEKIWTNSKASA